MAELGAVWGAVATEAPPPLPFSQVEQAEWVSGNSCHTGDEVPLVGQQLVGNRIGVLWPEHAAYMLGYVCQYAPKEQLHQVRYDDGDVEILKLDCEEWRLLMGDTTEAAAAVRAAGGSPGMQVEQDAVGMHLGDQASDADGDDEEVTQLQQTLAQLQRALQDTRTMYDRKAEGLEARLAKLTHEQVVCEKTAMLHEAEAATAAHHRDFDTLLQSLLCPPTGGSDGGSGPSIGQLRLPPLATVAAAAATAPAAAAWPMSVHPAADFATAAPPASVPAQAAGLAPAAPVSLPAAPVPGTSVAAGPSSPTHGAAWTAAAQSAGISVSAGGPRVTAPDTAAAALATAARGLVGGAALAASAEPAARLAARASMAAPSAPIAALPAAASAADTDTSAMAALTTALAAAHSPLTLMPPTVPPPAASRPQTSQAAVLWLV